jgi:hypothetical protein
VVGAGRGSADRHGGPVRELVPCLDPDLRMQHHPPLKRRSHWWCPAVGHRARVVPGVLEVDGRWWKGPRAVGGLLFAAVGTWSLGGRVEPATAKVKPQKRKRAAAVVAIVSTMTSVLMIGRSRTCFKTASGEGVNGEATIGGVVARW